LCVQSSLTSVEMEAMEKLHRRCMELEHQLAAERSSKEDQLSDVQQRQIDDIIVKYKERVRAIEDEKMEVTAAVCIYFSSEACNLSTRGPMIRLYSGLY